MRHAIPSSVALLALLLAFYFIRQRIAPRAVAMFLMIGIAGIGGAIGSFIDQGAAQVNASLDGFTRKYTGAGDVVTVIAIMLGVVLWVELRKNRRAGKWTWTCAALFPIALMFLPGPVGNAIRDLLATPSGTLANLMHHGRL